MPKDGIELMPEPEDRAILTAVDKGAVGYTGEDYGLSDKEARDLRRPLYGMSPFVWPYGAVGGAASIVVMMLLWPMIQPLITPYLPASEWAYDSSGVRQLGDEGLMVVGSKSA